MSSDWCGAGPFVSGARPSNQGSVIPPGGRSLACLPKSLQRLWGGLWGQRRRRGGRGQDSGQAPCADWLSSVSRATCTVQVGTTLAIGVAVRRCTSEPALARD